MLTKKHSILNSIQQQIDLWRWQRKLTRQYKAIMRQKTRSCYS